MVIIGGTICAAGVFIMALPTAWFQPAANGAIRTLARPQLPWTEWSIHPYYVMTAMYLIVFSIGEAFYSPRVYEYAAAIAPKGQEASYGALAYFRFSSANFSSARAAGFSPPFVRQRAAALRT